MTNPITHVEFHVKDAEKAANWYQQVFGWETSYNAEMEYGFFTAGTGQVTGGINPTSNLSGTLPYILVDDIVAALDQVKESGGQIIVPESPIPGVGKFGIFTDADGNTAAFLNYDKPPENEVKDLPHPINHIEFQTANRKKAADWYKKLFGWKIQHYDDFNYTTFTTEQQEDFGGGFNPAGKKPGVIVYVNAPSREDLDEVLKKAKDNGGTVVTEPFDTPGVGTFAFVSDLDGNHIGLMQSENSANN